MEQYVDFNELIVKVTEGKHYNKQNDLMILNLFKMVDTLMNGMTDPGCINVTVAVPSAVSTFNMEIKSTGLKQILPLVYILVC